MKFCLVQVILLRYACQFTHEFFYAIIACRVTDVVDEQTKGANGGAHALVQAFACRLVPVSHQ